MPDLITANVSLSFPPKTIFTPEFNKVEGSIKLAFRQPFNYDYDVTASFKGKRHMGHYFAGKERSYILESSNLDLFPDLKVVLVHLDKVPHSFDFSFYFPNSKTLPSSTKIDHNERQRHESLDREHFRREECKNILTIAYNIIFKVAVRSKSLPSSPVFEFVVPLKFQADDLNFPLHRCIDANSKQIIFHKIKGQINKRLSFFGNSKIPLKVSTRLPRFINWWDSIAIPLNFQSECPPKKASDYQTMDGSSTTLCRVTITSIEFGILHRITLMNRASMWTYWDAFTPTTCFFKKEGVAEFDIGRQWKYDSFLGSFVYSTTLGDLLNYHSSFLETFPGVFLNNVTEWYRLTNKNSFYLNIDVCCPTEKEKKGQVKRFAFETDVLFSTKCGKDELMKRDYGYDGPAEVLKSEQNANLDWL
ncbi:unnamed protein product [Ambrosiozyma monospora]|uniref:Unnamed protein product n=1 Tax=Ambrosiozyma monospora TaxID=43982 RepID=A0A9W6Z4G8_AMBMO|nr:unnamed protein product [Ambrosiozyma monospora]